MVISPRKFSYFVICFPPRASIFGRHQEKNLDASSFINIPQPKLLVESIVDGSILGNLRKQHSSISDSETESATCESTRLSLDNNNNLAQQTVTVTTYPLNDRWTCLGSLLLQH